METMIRLAEKNDQRMGRRSQSYMQALMDVLFASGFLGKLIDGLNGSWTAHCTTGPKRTEAPVDGIVETDYFAILARLVLSSVDGFCRAIASSPPTESKLHPTYDSFPPWSGVNTPDYNGSEQDLAETMKWLLEEWFSHFENIGDPSRRKLNCLALTKLLETGQPWILVNLQSLMTIWTDVITELREDEADTTGDSLVYNHDGGTTAEAYDIAHESLEDGRRRELTYEDVVHTVNLPAFVKGCLGRVVQGLGGEEAFAKSEWVANVDRDVLDGFVRLGVM
jgi:hypothetical protein